MTPRDYYYGGKNIVNGKTVTRNGIRFSDSKFLKIAGKGACKELVGKVFSYGGRDFGLHKQQFNMSGKYYYDVYDIYSGRYCMTAYTLKEIVSKMDEVAEKMERCPSNFFTKEMSIDN